MLDSTLTFDDVVALVNALQNGGLTSAESRSIAEKPWAVMAMLGAMRPYLATNLRQRRFHTLDQKLAMVRDWPGVTGAMIDEAVRQADGRIVWFEMERWQNPHINIVVSRYLPTPLDTFMYVMDRLVEEFGEEIEFLWKGEVFPSKVRYLDEDPRKVWSHRRVDCLRIEVVDLGDNYNPNRGTVVADTRGPDSAGFAALYSAIQDPEWVRQTETPSVPSVLACGIEMEVTGVEGWSHPLIRCLDGKIRVEPFRRDRTRVAALATVFQG